MNPFRTSTGVVPVKPIELNLARPTSNGVTKMYLIHEALSRARMRRPQADRTTASTEATRSARTVALKARQQAARELGTL
ncbi:hypothetical protein GCM10027605_63250 [Micromonospora zhanjiangensis]